MGVIKGETYEIPSDQKSTYGNSLRATRVKALSNNTEDGWIVKLLDGPQIGQTYFLSEEALLAGKGAAETSAAERSASAEGVDIFAMLGTMN